MASAPKTQNATTSPAGSGSSQTVNIDLSAFENNAFYVSGKDSEGKYTVGNFNYTG